MRNERSRRHGRPFLGGIVAGLIGGGLLSLYLVGLNLAEGNDVWQAMKVSGAPFLGQRALQPGFDAAAVACGVLSHFLVSVAWGLPFGLLFHGLNAWRTLVLGCLYGLVVWAGMFLVVLPVAGLGAMARTIPARTAAVEHVLFGFGLGLGFLPFQPRRARALEGAEEERLRKAARRPDPAGRG